MEELKGGFHITHFRVVSFFLHELLRAIKLVRCATPRRAIPAPFTGPDPKVEGFRGSRLPRTASWLPLQHTHIHIYIYVFLMIY